MAAGISAIIFLKKKVAGLARARAKGTRSGRPKIEADEGGIVAAFEAGVSIRRTAQQFGVSPAQVQRVLGLARQHRSLPISLH